MKNLKSLTLGQIVSADHRAAAILEKYNLDFCCHGNQNFDEVCTAANLNTQDIIKEIENLEPNESLVEFTEWPLDQLADYIFFRHHHYIEKVTPVIKKLLEKITAVHGVNHKELQEIKNIFDKTSGELAMHMKKEELILFPFIKKLARAKRDGVAVSSNLFNSVCGPIKKMEEDHTNEGGELQRMKELTNNFAPPSDACASYTATYKMLKEYELDMHTHIHLENHVLFPAAIALEQEMIATHGG